MTKHNADKNFNFPLMQNGSKGSALNYFIEAKNDINSRISNYANGKEALKGKKQNRYLIILGIF
jgi:hypothetical protein